MVNEAIDRVDSFDPNEKVLCVCEKQKSMKFNDNVSNTMLIITLRVRRFLFLLPFEQHEIVGANNH